MAARKKYWHGFISAQDDFGFPIKDTFIDGRTIYGSWALMTPDSFRIYGVGIGVGMGQQYIKTPEGWLLVAGGLGIAPVVAAALAPALAPAATSAVKSVGEILKILIKVGLIGGIGTIGYFFLRGTIRKAKAQKATRRLYNEPDGQIAVRIRTAVEGAGTNEEALYKAAAEVQDWKKVVRFYQQLYSRNIEDDLRDDLSAKEYEKFFKILNLSLKEDKGGSPEGAKTQFKRKDFFLAKHNANIRKSPVKAGGGHRIPFIRNTVIKMAKAGQFIGTATGKTKYDTGNDVLFYEVRVAILKSDKKIVTRYAWVAASQVEVRDSSERESLK